MKGQWIGKYQGTVDGNLMVNIDEVDDHYEGVAYILPYQKNFLPSAVAYFETNGKLSKHTAEAFINAVDPRTGVQCKWEEIKDIEGLFHKDATFSNQADVTLTFTDGKLHIDAISDIGTTLTSLLEKPAEDDASKISGDRMSWSDFKSRVSNMSESKYLFRGQQEPWRLRTSFHRRGRCRISEFTKKDVRQLHQRLSAITSHYFDLSIPDQNGSFFNLLQHHGYPTPLLDWSYSPYVAAFFAFRDWPINYTDTGDARIYIFDNEAWQRRFTNIRTSTIYLTFFRNFYRIVMY